MAKRSRSRSVSRGRRKLPSNWHMASNVARAAGTAYDAYKRVKSRSSSRVKASRSSSATRTRTRRRGPSAGSAGTDGSVSSFRYSVRRGVKVPKGFRKLLAPRHMNSVAFSKITSAVNRQGVNMVNLFNNGLAPANGTVVEAVPSFLDTELMMTNLLSDEAATSVGVNTIRYWIPFISLKITFRSMTSSPVHLKIYNCVARRDQEWRPTVAFNMANSPYTTWSAGLTDEFGPGSTPTLTVPGTTPFQSESFCQWWNVKSSKFVMLHPGAEHVHFVRIQLNRLHNRALTNDLAAIARESYACMAVVRGGVVQDAIATGNVGYGPATVDVMCDYHMEAQAVGKNRTIVSQYQYDGAITGTGQQVAEDTDTGAPVVNLG
ncbi:putative capsid protein [Arctopus echinatus-associated virus]|uniref:Putative capsid protein n=1 Tax=Arctopus echinatus-associated virus TaxID=2282642 RepID=A0A345BKA1_9VIRU|nr:putative capsid protein [Arctopus echinatus-associated virus]AXF50872.1 putative capsid protein [Arctopus echinatus-associated virus]